MCLGFVNESSDLLVLHHLLIARHYIYTCKLKNTTLTLALFTELVINSARIEKKFSTCLKRNGLGWVPSSFLFLFLLFFAFFWEEFAKGKMHYLVNYVVVVFIIIIIIIIIIIYYYF